MVFIIVLLCIVILIAVMYIISIAPRMNRASREQVKAFRGLMIAHRGLHGGDIRENTLPAFRKAVEAGYGIELDIRLSSDGIPVISHDNSLKRIFGIDKRTDSLTAGELSEIGVPRLSDVLGVIDGKVPLIAEIKEETSETGSCPAIASVFDSYKGPYCIQSFNPFVLCWYKKNRPAVIRGQLSTDFRLSKSKGNKLLFFIVGNLISDLVTRPDFISYNYKYAKNLSLTLCRKMGAVLMAWTLRSEEDAEACRRYFDSFIFEGYNPSANH